MPRTKDRYKKEEKEIERLIRKSPKIRDTRTDRRRETVEEYDSDMDGSDSDMSMNYKDIGGSLKDMSIDMACLSNKLSSILPDVSDDLNYIDSMVYHVLSFESDQRQLLGRLQRLKQIISSEYMGWQREELLMDVESLSEEIKAESV